MDWSNEVIFEFLNLYEREPVIWNPLNSGHKDRHKIYDAWKRIQESMSVECSLNDLKKKKETLMASYRKIAQKVKKYSQIGPGIKEEYKPEWFAYEKMASFLHNIYIPREGKTSDEPPSQQETWTPPIIEQPTPPPLKKLKQSPKDTAEELLGLATEYLNKPESEWEVMAKGWALKLSKLATDQRLFAEKIINDTLFEAQMGTLTRNGVRFLTASDSDSCRSSSKNEKFL
ncbi:uncharacterized protein [Halyomorpha halys]|uniref:uncharacterized protein isoform X5 n=1 Tax=Halyomorpha halys TaxID=286706 RepID=UPI0006D50089|nr:uncharacterized protein LOC106677777 isoform X4 [Halyomorpha halys]